MTRWKPTRAGIFNVWEYDDQVFDFGDGRLVLRGRNGSGKSNALSLLFPFVLDGVMSSTRMDPMGGGRSMKSLLLGRDDNSSGRYRHDSATGYVWMEFERDADEVDEMVDGSGGSAEFVTIGIGARATQQRDANAWFFVTPQRVGHDLELHVADTPKSAKELAASLSEGGEMYTTAEEYRGGVDRALFGLGPTRWRTLLDLLLTLRRPHLAGKLDTDHLSFALSSGLAELDVDLIADVAHSFDDLDAMAHELDGIGGALDAVERFLPIYRQHLLGVARTRAHRLDGLRRERERVIRDGRIATNERDAAATQAAESEEQLHENQLAQSRFETEIETIQVSPAFQNAAALSAVEGAVDNARRTADQAAEHHTAARAREHAAVTAASEAADRAHRAEADAVAALAGWSETSTAAGLTVGALDTLDDFDVERATAAIAARRVEFAEIETLVEDSLAATTEAERAAVAHDSAVERRRAADLADAEATQRLEHEVSVFAADLDAWAQQLDLVALQFGFGAVATAIEGLSMQDEQLERAVDRHMVEIDAGVRARRERVDLAATAASDGVDELLAERQRVADEPNPGPLPDPTRPDAGDPDRGGVPLYVCVDFAPGVADTDRAGLEAALDASGLLDARVMAGADDALDAVIVAAPVDGVTGEPGFGAASLADVLVPVPTADLDASLIHAALRSVPLESGLVRVGRDGSWQLGPLGGRFAKDRAEFIGHEARERRRAARLGELDGQLAEARVVLAGAERHVAELGEVSAALDTLRHDRPSQDAVRGAVDELFRCSTRALDARDQEAAAGAAADTANELADRTSSELHRRATAARLPTDRAGLREFVQLLGDCQRRQGAVVEARRRLEEQREVLAAAAAATTRATEESATAHGRWVDAVDFLSTEQLRFERLRDDVGADAQAAVESLAVAKRGLDGAKHHERSLRQVLGGAQASVAQLDERRRQLDVRAGELADDVDRAQQAMATVCSDEVADVVAIDGVDPSADPAAAARAVLADPTEVADDATNKMEQAHRTILLDGLRAGHDPSMPKLDGFDVIRVGTADGDLPIGSLARRLRDEHARLELLLSDREREIFETHLLARIGDALRELLYQADHFQQTINAEMAKAPTSSGMTVELKWDVDTDDPRLRDAVKTLRFSPDAMGPEQRETLRAFFSEQIAARRAADAGLSFVEVLTSALDYRTWHSFTFFVRSAGGGRQQVTRRYFKDLSGGEAATVLHLPLFASAAAHYSSGAIDGPRIIALDEAFAGIDDDMRGRLMGLLVQLDLDVVLTSHEFWGFYGQVPDLVVYDLNRKPPTPGVFAQRIQWSSAPT